MRPTTYRNNTLTRTAGTNSEAQPRWTVPESSCHPGTVGSNIIPNREVSQTSSQFHLHEKSTRGSDLRAKPVLDGRTNYPGRTRLKVGQETEKDYRQEEAQPPLKFQTLASSSMTQIGILPLRYSTIMLDMDRRNALKLNSTSRLDKYVE
ncbi:Hypothetical protein NTJ_00942 [Nesidiocoris tenuis]|uniref:Uncharacterized protein n=1 Tax=Nesidiocoris tenuis TaxID=355587 RepID=A0ABN7A787_9HEMI|nr:Hypothetical protein NTJ_00942 [Nesidiocoris tenuis]